MEKANQKKRIMKCVQCNGGNTRFAFPFQFRFYRKLRGHVKITCDDCKAVWRTPYP
jgi:hypothetical protein